MVYRSDLDGSVTLTAPENGNNLMISALEGAF
jgi:hypothetical protein